MMNSTAPYERTDRILTVPNIICVARLFVAPILIVFALGGQSAPFLWLFVALAISDWVDGKLAILLNQRSVWGPRLDSWADSAFYLALLIGSIILHGPTLLSESGWIIPALASYALTTGAGWWKYRCWPSYHTRAAKISWFLILIGSICLLAEWNLWPLRIALFAIALTNIEALFITILTPDRREDVESILHLLHERKIGRKAK